MLAHLTAPSQTIHHLLQAMFVLSLAVHHEIQQPDLHAYVLPEELHLQINGIVLHHVAVLEVNALPQALLVLVEVHHVQHIYNGHLLQL